MQLYADRDIEKSEETGLIFGGNDPRRRQQNWPAKGGTTFDTIRKGGIRKPSLKMLIPRTHTLNFDSEIWKLLYPQHLFLRHH